MKLSLNIIIVLLVAVVKAASVKTSGVTLDELSKFDLFSQYAGASYCYSNFHDHIGNVTCAGEGGSCPKVEMAQVSITHPFQLGKSKTAGFVATDHANKLIVVAVQGVQAESNPMSQATSSNLKQVRTQLCGFQNQTDGCLIHGGIFLATMDVKIEVTRAIDEASKAHPDYRIVTTGHSLGGAVATLLGTMLRSDGHIVDIYTYGHPHIGGRDISNYIQNQAPSKGSNFRITHADDLVPQLPGTRWGNWGHFYPEFWITKKSGVVGTKDIKKVDGQFYTKEGNEGFGYAKGSMMSFMLGAIFRVPGIPAHRDYFGKISACNSNPPKAKKGSKRPKA